MTLFYIPHRPDLPKTSVLQAHTRAMRALLEEKGIGPHSRVRVDGREGVFTVRKIDEDQRVTLATSCGVVLRDTVSPRALTLEK